MDDEVLSDLRDDLADVYGDILDQGGATILINEQPLAVRPYLSEAALAETFAFPPGFQPSRHRFQLQWRGPVIEGGVHRDVTRKLGLELIVGLTPRQDNTRSGVYMFGQPTTESGARLGARKFTREPLQDESVGYSSGPRSYLRKNHPTLGRLRVYAIFSGDSEQIPWGMPGWRSSAVTTPRTRSPSRSAIGLAKSRVHMLASRRRPARSISFRLRVWNGLSEPDRKLLLRRGAYLGPDDLDERDVRARVQPLIQHDFGAPTFRAWDHTVDGETAPEPAPAFDDASSKEVVALITERDRRLKELKDGDPIASVDTLMGTLQAIRERDEDGWVPEDDEEDHRPAERSVTVTVRFMRASVRSLLAKTGSPTKAEAVLKAVEEYLDTDGTR